MIRFSLTGGHDLRALEPAYLEWLDRSEIQRYRAFRRERDRRDYLAAHALLRRSLADAGGNASDPSALTFTRDERGKPGVEELELPFSLTHCRGLVACAVGGPGARLGIDAEPLEAAARLVDLEEVFLTGIERAALPSRDPIARRRALVRLWTAKEAVAKAEGTGFADLQGANGLRQWECTEFASRTGGCREATVGHFSVRSWEVDGRYALTLALEADTERCSETWRPEEYRLLSSVSRC